MSSQETTQQWQNEAKGEHMKTYFMAVMKAAEEKIQAASEEMAACKRIFCAELDKELSLLELEKTRQAAAAAAEQQEVSKLKAKNAELMRTVKAQNEALVQVRKARDEEQKNRILATGLLEEEKGKREEVEIELGLFREAAARSCSEFGKMVRQSKELERIVRLVGIDPNQYPWAPESQSTVSRGQHRRKQGSLMTEQDGKAEEDTKESTSSSKSKKNDSAQRQGPPARGAKAVGTSVSVVYNAKDKGPIKDTGSRNCRTLQDPQAGLVGPSTTQPEVSNKKKNQVSQPLVGKGNKKPKHGGKNKTGPASKEDLW